MNAAREGDTERMERALFEEQSRERELDRAYWAPLRAELEELRQAYRKMRQGSPGDYE